APVYGFYVVAEHTPAGAESETDGLPNSATPGAAEIVGALMVTFEWSDWRNGLFWWIQSVYVRPDWRRRGVYRALYDFLKQLAAGPGYRGYVCGFRLYVEKRNVIAQQTYERLGMTETYYKMYEEEIMNPEEMVDAQLDAD
ncbi:MAG TPA: GNAT family N-acetyltransferase, partial [Pyrinomonadaceae bacterium]|nr:GNAT family N-acetyltransferase [Pyrinomonadaceae bacterium]